MPWFSHLLLAFSNLRALNLNGAWSFHDATIIHQAILKSRVTLRVLGIYRPQHPFIARISDSDPRPRERASLFWARLIELLTESVRAEREARDSDPRSGDKLAERVVGPPLRLDTLTINDDAIADFASLTDLASLRRLGLVHGSGALDILSRDRPLGQRPQLPQAAADCFHDAVGLELIESDYVDPSVRELMDVLKKAGNKTVRHVAINRSWDRRDWPPAPWADNRFS